jgi:hypothetical protein
MTTQEEIEGRFQSNLQRVRNVVEVYTSSFEKRKGRRPVQETDILRAAVVLLHATLEDLLRSLAEWKLPTAKSEALLEIPLAGTRGKTRFGIQELAGFRGMTVESVIRDSVYEYLEKTSYNHPGDVKSLLEKIGLEPRIVDAHAVRLAAMMSRRHWIAHRADRNPSEGSGHHRVKGLSNLTVSEWIETVEQLGNGVLSEV